MPKKQFLFSVYTCRPTAKTFGTITYFGLADNDYLQRLVRPNKVSLYSELNDTCFKGVRYNEIVYFIVEAEYALEAIRQIRLGGNPDLQDVRDLEKRQYPKGKWWSYTRR